MKKILLISVLAAGVLTSCDPIKETGTFVVDQVTASELFEGATFAQYDGAKDADGNMVYTPSDDGNYIEFSIPKVSAVTIYYIKSDGSESTLSYGTNAGMFNFMPTRGSDTNQTLYFRYINADAEEIVATKVFTLQVAQELSTETKLLTSNSGSKKWYWSSTSCCQDGTVWGNGGYQAGAQDGSASINGGWWGCGTEDGVLAGDNTFNGQLGHSAAGSLTGEEYENSYMEFNEDGSLDKYDYNGNKLNSGTFSIYGYDNGASIDDLGNMAYLDTSEGAILWPYAINTGGYMPTTFEVAYISVDRLILIYAAEGTGAWSECTWWSFSSDDDAEGFLTSGKWGWNDTSCCQDGTVWGNAGYLAGEQDGGTSINGGWWGCGTEDGVLAGENTFSGQLGHSAVGALTGEEYSTSYMLFGEDGSLVKYDNNGSVLNEGTYTLDMTANPDTYSVGALNTSAGAILWPYAINLGGYEPTAFEIGYISSNRLVLIYAPEGTGSWSECTWWSFGPIE